MLHWSWYRYIKAMFYMFCMHLAIQSSYNESRWIDLLNKKTQQQVMVQLARFDSFATHLDAFQQGLAHVG